MLFQLLYLGEKNYPSQITMVASWTRSMDCIATPKCAYTSASLIGMWRFFENEMLSHFSGPFLAQSFFCLLHLFFALTLSFLWITFYDPINYWWFFSNTSNFFWNHVSHSLRRLLKSKTPHFRGTQHIWSDTTNIRSTKNDALSKKCVLLTKKWFQTNFHSCHQGLDLRSLSTIGM